MDVSHGWSANIHVQNEERIFAYIQLEAASILMNEKYTEGHDNVLHVMERSLSCKCGMLQGVLQPAALLIE